MKRLGQSFLLITLILVALPVGVGGAVTATYTPEIPIYIKAKPGIFTNPNVVGAKIGTITVISTGTFYNPGLMTIGPMASGIDMLAYCRDSSSNPTYTLRTIPFFVVSVAYPNGRGGAPVITTPYGPQWPLLTPTTGVAVNVNFFYVDLYLLHANPGTTTNPASVQPFQYTPATMQPDKPITFKNPFNPFFTIGVASKSDKGVYDYAQGPGGSLSSGTTDGSYVTIDGVWGPSSTPLLDPGGYTAPEDGGDGFWFGDNPPKPLNFFFSFLHNTVNFELSDAYEEKSDLYLNTAQMVVENGVTGTTYKQKITFTDIWGGPTFQLKPDVDSDGIDFNLVFGSKSVNYGEGDDWENLVPGPNNEMILYIKGIKPSQVNQRVSGEYTDTIIVNITAADN